MLELASAKDFAQKDLALWWLMNRKGNAWKEYDIDGSLKSLGLYDPETVKIVAVEMPPELKDPTPLPSAAEIARLTGDAARGQVSAAFCTTCHRIGKIGIDYGPDLSAFGKQQTNETIIQAIVEPSATIAHGFEGRIVTTTDGLTITGLVLSRGDPLIIKSMGGLVQTIPQSRIASLTRMKRSLMYQPQMMGLTPQSIADIVAYLKTQ